MNTNEFDDNLRIYLHEKDKFFYSTRSQEGSLFIDKESFTKTGNSHPRAVGKKSRKESLIAIQALFLIDKSLTYMCQNYLFFSYRQNRKETIYI